ncbi:mitochondrial cardiolipin hydrolase [Fopius arisanus]|uniref:Mitochondrial cardiolipin hydrolase n=1 Tax=Fopius arisanus TaxID=64838 RepID=A0A9R1TTK4_9HYME|nr:PREDICTED: mitochondrial cardiolipin hydrolase [Fopius arisanus]
MNSAVKFGIGFLIFSVGTELAWQLWKKYFRENKDSNYKIITEVLIFNSEGADCRTHSMTNMSCGISHCPVRNVRKLLSFFDSAKKTLDICIYILTSKDLTDAIIRAHERGITIRLMVDSIMSENSACSFQLTRIRRAGIKVLMHRSTVSLMHHKFAIMDEKLMIFGSTNWTMQAFFGNFDATLITNQTELVRVFSSEFNRMWNVISLFYADLASETGRNYIY